MMADGSLRPSSVAALDARDVLVHLAPRLTGLASRDRREDAPVHLDRVLRPTGNPRNIWPTGCRMPSLASDTTSEGHAV